MLCKQPTTLLTHLTHGFDELLFASSFAMRSPRSFRFSRGWKLFPGDRHKNAVIAHMENETG
jgi:hypothetical protein